MDDPKAIINAYIDNELTKDQLRELAAWMCETPENRRRFITDCYLHSQLQDIFAGEKIAREAAEPVDADCGDDATAVASSGFIPFVSGIYHDTLGFFSQEIPFALLVATFITSLGLVVGSMIYVTHHQPLASGALPPTLKAMPSKTEYVGQVTGMVNVVWADDSTAALNGAGVPLGRKYALASGLMEITYHTGAKVILQGPVTYEADSRDGGYLSVGKLTARLEKKQSANSDQQSERVASKEGSGFRGQGSAKVAGGQSSVASETNPKSQIAKSQISNPQSLIPDPSSSPAPRSQSPIPMFAVRTPTATITDLGTEFGVEVNHQKVCHVETFVGLVSVSPVAGSKSKDSRHLAAGEAMSIDGRGIMAKTPARSTRFVRRIRQKQLTPYAEVVLADRPLVYWPLNDSPAASWVVDRSGHGCSGHFFGNVRFMPRGPFSEDRSRSAEFSGNGYIQTDPLPPSDPTKGFTVEVWTRVDGDNGMLRTLLTYCDKRGVTNRTGFALYVATDGRWTFPTGTGEFWASVAGPPVVSGQWVYVAGTFTPTKQIAGGAFWGIQNLYINGRLVAKGKQPWKPRDSMPVRIGTGIAGSPMGDSCFVGGIAEVAIYDRPLDYDRIKAHWEVGQTPNTGIKPQQKEATSNVTPKK